MMPPAGVFGDKRSSRSVFDVHEGGGGKGCGFGAVFGVKGDAADGEFASVTFDGDFDFGVAHGEWAQEVCAEVNCGAIAKAAVCAG